MRRTDPETSHKAAESVDVGELEGMVLRALEPEPLTCPEIALLVGRERDSVSPRMPRLERLGYVKNAGTKIPPGRNRASTVWALTGLGLWQIS